MFASCFLPSEYASMFHIHRKGKRNEIILSPVIWNLDDGVPQPIKKQFLIVYKKPLFYFPRVETVFCHRTGLANVADQGASPRWLPVFLLLWFRFVTSCELPLCSETLYAVVLLPPSPATRCVLFKYFKRSLAKYPAVRLPAKQLYRRSCRCFTAKRLRDCGV